MGIMQRGGAWAFLSRPVCSLDLDCKAELSVADYPKQIQECIRTGNLGLGRYVHQQMVRDGLLRQCRYGNMIINMYAKCGDMAEARSVLEGMMDSNTADVISWTSLISGYAGQGDWIQAFDALRRMQHEGVAPNSCTLTCIFKVCACDAEALESGMRIHQAILDSSGWFSPEDNLWPTLLNMYGSFGLLQKVREVFNSISVKNVATWSVMLSAYAKAIEMDGNGKFNTPKLHLWRQEASELFRNLLNQGVKPDMVMFLTLVGLCADLKEAVFLYSCIQEAGFGAHPKVCHALIAMYGRLEVPEAAEEIFRRMLDQNVVAWTSMIKAARKEEALVFFRQMLVEGVRPNSLTFAEVLNACSAIAGAPSSRLQEACLSTGRSVHACMMEAGYARSMILETPLICMYSKCAALDEAERFFESMQRKNVGAWTAMITANVERGQSKQAMLLFRRMQQEGITPNIVTFVAAISACSAPEYLSQGRLLHSYVVQKGFDSDCIVGNTLLTMYGKCGSIHEAKEVFEKMNKSYKVTWSAMLAAYGNAAVDKHSISEEALLLFRKMQLEGFMPEKVTIVSVLRCCTELKAGKELHAIAAECMGTGSLLLTYGNDEDCVLRNAVVSMYSRCGALETAEEIFRKAEFRDSILWNEMITCYALNGLESTATSLFSEMLLEGINPQATTFLSIILACNHAGLVQRGCGYFASVSLDFGLSPQIEHSGCVSDMLGRAGHLSEAQQVLDAAAAAFADEKPVHWAMLLGSCCAHGDVERARMASGNILKVCPTSSAAYAGLARLYTTSTPQHG